MATLIYSTAAVSW